jgi:pilus assembly protein Flp/PilA
MNDVLLNLFVKMQTLMIREEGQDLVEYALVVGLISVAAVGVLKILATDVNAVFTNISTTLGAA